MRYKKTALGLAAMKTRDGVLTQVQRTALIMFDGIKTDDEVLAAMSGIRLMKDDIARLLDLGYLELVDAAQGAPTPRPASVTPVATAAPVSMAEPSGLSEQDCYKLAYPIATKLTSGLGLRGFRLNLSLEAAASYQDLVVLAPKIREAVGEAKFEELKAALRR